METRSELEAVRGCSSSAQGLGDLKFDTPDRLDTLLHPCETVKSYLLSNKDKGLVSTIVDRRPSRNDRSRSGGDWRRSKR
jgi:hypothetical protein